MSTVKNHDETEILANSTKTIVESLQNIIQDENQILRGMAKGNFNVHSSCHEMYQGDFAPLLSSLQDIAHSLNDTLTKISSATVQVDSKRRSGFRRFPGVVPGSHGTGKLCGRTGRHH